MIPDDVVERALEKWRAAYADEEGCRRAPDWQEFCLRAALQVGVEWARERICTLIIKETHPPRMAHDDYNDEIADEGERIVGLIRSRAQSIGETNRAESAEHKLAMVSELALATSALIALFPADIDERKAAIIRRARVAIAELEQETVTDPDGASMSVKQFPDGAGDPIRVDDAGAAQEGPNPD